MTKISQTKMSNDKNVGWLHIIWQTETVIQKMSDNEIVYQKKKNQPTKMSDKKNLSDWTVVFYSDILCFQEPF